MIGQVDGVLQNRAGPGRYGFAKELERGESDWRRIDGRSRNVFGVEGYRTREPADEHLAIVGTEAGTPAGEVQPG